MVDGEAAPGRDRTAEAFDVGDGLAWGNRPGTTFTGQQAEDLMADDAHWRGRATKAAAAEKPAAPRNGLPSLPVAHSPTTTLRRAGRGAP